MNFKIGDGDSKTGLKAVAKSVKVGLNAPLFVMAGPCVIESRDNCLRIAEKLITVAEKTDVGIIFKASFDKANRSSVSSFRGPGLEKGLKILADVRRQTDMPVMTDVHEALQAADAAAVVDCLADSGVFMQADGFTLGVRTDRQARKYKKGPAYVAR